MIKETMKDKVDRLVWKAQIKARCAGQNVKQIGKWAFSHPVEAGTIATAGATIIGGTSKIVSKIAKAHAEKDRMKRYYDPRQFNWVRTRRELTGKEKIEFSRRRDNGESVTSILESMGLIKR